MKKTLIMLITASALGISCTKDHNLPQEQLKVQGKLVGSTDGEKEEGTLLVKFKEEAVSAIKNGENVLDGIDLCGIEPVFSSSRNETVAKKYGLHQWYKVRFDDILSPETMAAAIADDDDVEFLEYNSLIDHSLLSDGVEYNPVALTRSTAAETPGDLPFNDPMLAQQWHLINEGNQELVPHSVAGADMALKDAWRLSTGDNRVIVAVFDMGVMTFHPDLSKVLWVNEKEANGSFGTDDDGNGYKDDVNGFNFYDKSGRIEATGNNSAVGHGTHVAGSIAAQNGNGKGVSSIAGGSGAPVYDGVRIMSCQIFKAGSTPATGLQASTSQVAEAFRYAADNGACIAQCSYGTKENEDKESIEYNALLYFTDPANANCPAVDRNIAVFSAGNYNMDASCYPGMHPFCISVTATGPDNLPAGYSNYGTGCDIAAPGGDPCLVNESEIGKDMRTCILSTGVAGTGSTYNEAGYVYNFGTSMACPQVSGVIALGMSYALKIGKTFTFEDFRSRLLASANDIDQYMLPGNRKFFNNNTREYDWFDPASRKGKMGSGGVDAWKFLISLEGTPTVVTTPGRPTGIDLSEYAGNLNNIDFEISIDDADRESLGIGESLAAEGGTLSFTCTKTGSGKIRISGTDFYREIAVASRTSATNNGGWL